MKLLSFLAAPMQTACTILNLALRKKKTQANSMILSLNQRQASAYGQLVCFLHNENTVFRTTGLGVASLCYRNTTEWRRLIMLRMETSFGPLSIR
jgi:hypothetical protein